MIRQRTICLSSFVASLCLASTTLGGHTLRLVAQTGNPAPGSLGGSFTQLRYPQINASGQVAFVAYTDGQVAESGMWLSKFSNPQQLGLIVGHDYPVPGAPADVRFGDFESAYYHPLLLDSGDVAFSAPIAGSSLSGIGVFRMIEGSVERILLDGDAAPGLPSGITVGSIGNLIAASPNGEVAFNVEFTGAAVNADNDRAVYRCDAEGASELLFREGSAAPGLVGTTFVVWPAQHPLIGNDGRVGFRTGLEGAVNAQWSHWLGAPGDFDLIVKYGDPSPLGGTFVGLSLDF